MGFDRDLGRRVQARVGIQHAHRVREAANAYFRSQGARADEEMLLVAFRQVRAEATAEEIAAEAESFRAGGQPLGKKAGQNGAP